MSIERMIREEGLPFSGDSRLGGIAFLHGYFTLTPVEYRTLMLIHFPSDKLCSWNLSDPLISELAKRKIEVALLTVDKHPPDWLGKNRRNYGHLVRLPSVLQLPRTSTSPKCHACYAKPGSNTSNIIRHGEPRTIPEAPNTAPVAQNQLPTLLATSCHAVLTVVL